MCTSSSSDFHWNLPSEISRAMALSTPVMSLNSALVSKPTLCSMVACAMEPRISCSHSRQSNEMDSVNAATSAEGPDLKRPLRETGLDFFMPLPDRIWRLEMRKSRPEQSIVLDLRIAGNNLGL